MKPFHTQFPDINVHTSDLGNAIVIATMNVILDRTHPGGFRGYTENSRWRGWTWRSYSLSALLILKQVLIKKTASLIHMLKNLSQIIIVLYSLDSKRIFFPTNKVRTSVIGKQRMRKKYIKKTVPLDVVPELRTERCFPRFSSVIGFGAKVQIPVARQGGREMSAPRPYVSDPFHSLS